MVPTRFLCIKDRRGKEWFEDLGQNDNLYLVICTIVWDLDGGRCGNYTRSNDFTQTDRDIPMYIYISNELNLLSNELNLNIIIKYLIVLYLF